MNLKNQIKTLSYYCPELIEEYKLSICNAINNMKLESSKQDEMTLSEEIEKKIKQKYNLLIPAIFLEVKIGQNEIALEKDDLSRVITTNLVLQLLRKYQVHRNQR
jgi:hypothetical protein